MVHKKVILQVLDVTSILQKKLRCWLVQPIISTWRWTCMAWHAVDDLQLEKSRNLTPCPGKPPTPKGNWPKPCQVDKVHCLHGSLKTICQIPVQFQVVKIPVQCPLTSNLATFPIPAANARRPCDQLGVLASLWTAGWKTKGKHCDRRTSQQHKLWQATPQRFVALIRKISCKEQAWIHTLANVAEHVDMACIQDWSLTIACDRMVARNQMFRAVHCLPQTRRQDVTSRWGDCSRIHTVEQLKMTS